MREVELTFAGPRATCDKSVLSCKLLHLKRLLHRRVEASISGQGPFSRYRAWPYESESESVSVDVSVSVCLCVLASVLASVRACVRACVFAHERSRR